MALIYTTEEAIRRDAGFVNNSNVSDENDILPNGESAEAEIDGEIAVRYRLPFSDNAFFSGSQAEKVLEAIARMLGAGYLQLQLYEGQGGIITEQAYKKISIAKSRLNKIAKGEIILVGNDGLELTQNSLGIGQKSLSGLPNSNSTPSKFSSSMIF